MSGAVADLSGVQTVEALVRRQMAQSLGGVRGMLEAAVPGIVFTVAWLVTKDLRLALVASLGVAGLALAARLLQRSSVQYVANALFAILIGWVFVRIAQASGGTPDEQALAYFLPGIIISLVYTIGFTVSCVVGWPALGFMLGSVTGDVTAWHDDPQVVKLCTRLTWVMAAPGAVGVLLQGPVWLLGHSGVITAAAAAVAITVLRSFLGWGLRAASWSTMIWLLARNATPLERANPDLAT